MTTTVSSIPVFQPDTPGHRVDPLYFQNPTRTFIDPYRKLGPVFRCHFFGNPQVALGGVEANRFVWSKHELWDYYKTNRIFREQFSNRYLNQLEGEAYLMKRRRINQGFKPSMLLTHVPAMSEVVVREIEKLNGEPTDFRLFCMSLVIAMVSRVLLQEDLPDGMDRIMAISNQEMLKASSLGWKRWLWYWYPPKRAKRRVIFKYLGEVVDRRKKSGVEKDDILSLILAAHPKDQPPIPRYELIHDMSQLFMGGSTTSSMIIGWSLIESWMHPEWLVELRKELTQWDPAKFESMRPFPKLYATSLEIERLRPGVPVFPRFAKQDFEFNGFQVKQGESVLHLHTLCHFLEEHYEDPLSFRPARFLDNPNLPERDVHGTYGGGQHKCVGLNLARVAPPIAVATILADYDLQFTPTPSGKESYRSVTAPREDLMVRFVPRH
ncbi:MAG: cytochrome P450 [Verrucomicrobiae bacterium]|nr:cytochrome P450 [Verrucomicrobiae bacterium]